MLMDFLFLIFSSPSWETCMNVLNEKWHIKLMISINQKTENGSSKVSWVNYYWYNNIIKVQSWISWEVCMTLQHPTPWGLTMTMDFMRSMLEMDKLNTWGLILDSMESMGKSCMLLSDSVGSMVERTRLVCKTRLC